MKAKKEFGFKDVGDWLRLVLSQRGPTSLGELYTAASRLYGWTPTAVDKAFRAEPRIIRTGSILTLLPVVEDKPAVVKVKPSTSMQDVLFAVQNDIDEVYGCGYARRHPELMAEVMKAKLRM